MTDQTVKPADAVVDADEKVLDALHGTSHSLASKAMVLCGMMSGFTVNACALMFFVMCLIHVIRNGAWPPNVGWGITSVMLAGPVLTNWQFMGVRKILTAIFSEHNSVGSIVKEVVVRRMGGTPPPPPPQQ